jgi:cytoskeletal protein RodZ
VQPSSLVFLVIIAVWAAYFIQFWVRRREHLATVHSVDQFSESMRVLERHAPAAAEATSPQGSSYAAASARGARSAILEKPVSASPPEPVAQATSSARVAPSGANHSGGDRTGADRSASGRTGADRSASGRTGASRRLRGATLLLMLAAMVAVLPLAALSVLPWVALVAPVVGLVGAFGWVRRGVAAERTARRSTRPPVRRPEAAVPQPVSASGVKAADTPVVEPLVDGLLVSEAPEVSEGLQAPLAPERAELYDLQAIEHAATAAAAPAPAAPEATWTPTRPLVDDDDIPLTWDPVPVPRPTYAMKSRVTRPAPTAADLVGDADTEYAAFEEEPARRLAGA